MRLILVSYLTLTASLQGCVENCTDCPSAKLVGQIQAPRGVADGAISLDSVYKQSQRERRIHSTDQDDNSPLHYAAGFGQTEIIAMLIEHGADVNARNTFQDTPLHWAASNGHVAAIALLISKGASVDSISGNGETPLHLAVDKGHLAAVELLLRSKASANALTTIGESPLDYVLNRSDIRDCLLHYGATR